MKSKKGFTKLVVVLFTFYTVAIKGQQNPQYTQYMYSMNVVNPAYAGSQDILSFNFLARTQWVGIDGAPETLTFGAHSPVGNNIGLGISAIVDKLGPLEEQNLYGDFSYTVRTSDNANLAFGLKAGVTFFNASLAQLETVNQNDPVFTDNINKVLPNFGVGAFYYTNKFYVGLSVPNLLETFHFDKKEGQVSRASELKHFFLTSGYVFDLSDTYQFKPSVMVKAAQGSPLSIDFSGSIFFKRKVELGLSYRLDDSVSALINLRASDSLRIGYAYDYTLTNLGNFSSGSHEVFLLFNFSFERNKYKPLRCF